MPIVRAVRAASGGLSRYASGRRQAAADAVASWRTRPGATGGALLALLLLAEVTGCDRPQRPV
jgi:hypothetical protein